MINRLVLGTAKWGSEVDIDAAFSILNTFVNYGGTHIDTSTNYPINGIESDFEYIRSGANFKQLEKVCDSFYELTKKYDNFKMGCHYTLSWMNCLKFADFYNWMSYRYPEIDDLYISKLEQPDHYSIEILSLELRTKVYNEVISKLNLSATEGYKNGLFLYKEHMLSTAFDNFNLEKFIYGVNILRHIYDTRRGTDSSKIINDFTKFIGIKI